MMQDLCAVAATEIQGPVDGAVHVWRIRVDAFEGGRAQQAWLSPDECLRANRLRFEIGRRQFVAVRCALRGILALYSGRHPKEVRFRYGRGGKPELATPLDSSGLRFNVSHSGMLALCAVAHDRRIGVDIEHVCLPPSADAIVDRIFAPRERKEYYSAPEHERASLFFRVWTLKEAFVKAVGEGLNRLLGQRESALDLRSRPKVRTAGGSTLAAQTWSAVELTPGPEYMAAAIVEGNVKSVKCWEWRWSDEMAISGAPR
jgi:4'-phosphopantetheinyl transferase